MFSNFRTGWISVEKIAVTGILEAPAATYMTGRIAALRGVNKSVQDLNFNFFYVASQLTNCFCRQLSMAGSNKKAALFWQHFWILDDLYREYTCISVFHLVQYIVWLLALLVRSQKPSVPSDQADPQCCKVCSRNLLFLWQWQIDILDSESRTNSMDCKQV